MDFPTLPDFSTFSVVAGLTSLICSIVIGLVCWYRGKTFGHKQGHQQGYSRGNEAGTRAGLIRGGRRGEVLGYEKGWAKGAEVGYTKARKEELKADMGPLDRASPQLYKATSQLIAELRNDIVDAELHATEECDAKLAAIQKACGFEHELEVERERAAKLREEMDLLRHGPLRLLTQGDVERCKQKQASDVEMINKTIEYMSKKTLSSDGEIAGALPPATEEHLAKNGFEPGTAMNNAKFVGFGSLGPAGVMLANMPSFANEHPSFVVG